MPENLKPGGLSLVFAFPLLALLICLTISPWASRDLALASQPPAVPPSAKVDGHLAQPETIASLDQYLQAHPQDSSVWLKLSKTYLLANDYKQALASAQMASFFNHQAYEALKMQAEINLQLGRFAEARELGIYLATENAKDHFGYLFLAKLGTLNQEFPGVGAWALRLAKARAVSDCQLFCQLGQIFFAQAQQLSASSQAQDYYFDLAESAYQQALAAKSSDFDANLGLAQTLMARGDYALALTDAEKAESIQPANKQAKEVASEASKDKNDWGLQISHLFKTLTSQH
jgi:tetratricopeptide (TPR) repeat protein